MPKVAPKPKRSIAERDALVLQWSGLPSFVANKLMRTNAFVQNLGFDDAVAHGNIALIRAAELYDENIAKFNTYAITSIRRYIVQAAHENLIIKVPTDYLNNGVEKYSDSRALLWKKSHDMAGAVTLAGKFSERLDEDNRANLKMLEVYDPDPLEAIERRQLIKRAMRPLEGRVKLVVREVLLRGQTYETVSKRLGCCKERVRQLLEEGLATMRFHLGVNRPPEDRKEHSTKFECAMCGKYINQDRAVCVRCEKRWHGRRHNRNVFRAIGGGR